LNILLLRNNEITNVNLSDELNRFEQERNGWDSLLNQPKLVDRFFDDSQMNNLLILVKFFQFIQRSIITSKQNSFKLVLRLPGSKLLTFAYAYLKPSPSDDEEEKNLLEKFVLILSQVLKSLLELHPSCWGQLDSIGIFDRLETYSQKSSNEEIQLEVATLISQTEKLREKMTKKQKSKIEISLDRDDPPPDDFHQVNI
jgi:hypothetical protein